MGDGTVYASHVAGVFAYDLPGSDERWSLAAGALQQLLGGGLSPIGDLVLSGDSLFLQQDGDVYGLGPG